MYKVALYFLYFIMYSIFGWCLEMVYCTTLDTKHNKKFTIHNRGFLYGPLCPIYGSATTVMLLGLSGIADNIPLMALVGMVLCDFVEYMTSLIMEKLFHTRWWDYSKKFLNLHGRIDFEHSIQWAVLSVVFVRYVHPFFSSKVFPLFNEIQIEIIALGVFIYFMYDVINTVLSTISIRDLQAKMEKIRTSFGSLEVGEEIPDISLFIREYKEKLSLLTKKRRSRHILNEIPQVMSFMENELIDLQKAPHEFMDELEDIHQDIVNFIDDHRTEMH